MQPFQARRKMLIVSRLAALALLARPRPRYEGLNLMRAARMAGVLETSKSFLGTLKRLVSQVSRSAPAGRRRGRP
jgi:coenzyme F420 hydrogenase subunit beta